jgi:hypothetical protein
MATNYVEIKIKASDTAKPDLTSLKAQLDELGSKTESAKVSVDDKDAAAKLLDVNAKLARLGKTLASPRITVAGAARAEAEIARLNAQLDHLGGKSEGVTTLKSRLMSLGRTAADVGTGGFSGLGQDAGMASKAMAGFSLATGLLEAPMAGLIVGVGGLASGLVAAGAGLGAFGLVAKANFTTASTAATQVQTAQIAYNAAIKAGAKQSTAYVAEQKAIGVAYAQLSPAQIALSKNIGNAQNSWQSFVQSNTSGVSKIMSQGIGLMPKVFQSMQAFMGPTEQALHGLIGQLGKGLGSSGFKSFIDMLAKNSGPAITKIGDAIGHIVVGLGGIIKAFMPFAQIMLSGLDKITAKFAAWGSTLTQHSGFKSLVSMAQQDMPLVIQIVKNLGAAMVHLGSSMTGISTFANSKSLLQLAVPLSQLVNWLSKANPALLRTGLYLLAAGGAAKKIKPAFDGIKGGIDAIKGGVGAFSKLKSGFTDAETAASEASGVWGTLGGKLSAVISGIREWGIWSKIAAAATKVWTGIQAAFDVVMDANPVALVVIAIAALVAAVVLAYMHFKKFREVVNTVMKDVWHAVEAAFDWIKGHWKLLLAILTGPIGAAAIFIISHWHQILAGAQHMVGSVIGFFRSLPGRILGAIASLPGLMFSAGAHVLSSLLSGIGSMVGSVVSTVAGWGHDIANAIGSPFGIHFSEPSEATKMIAAGQRVAQGLGKGMLAGAGGLHAAAAVVSGAAMPRAGGYGVAGSGAGGQVLRVELEWAGSGGSNQQFLTWLRNNIRARGGLVKVLGP